MLATFFAHTHVLLVHGPIALVLALLAFEAWMMLRKRSSPTDASRFLVVLAAASAIASTATGLVYENVETFNGSAAQTVELHERVALGATAWTLLAAALHVLWEKKGDARLRTGYLVALLLAGTSVAGAGHLGGTLVHGEGYLTGSEDAEPPSGSPSTGASTAAANAAVAAALAEPADDLQVRSRRRDDPALLARGDKVDFARDVKPIFDRSCTKCHSAEKAKGKLRLDDKAAAMKGGESGAVIVPGKPEESELIRAISLPPDHEDVMPEKGRLLSTSEIELLKEWVREGAHWPDDG